MTAVLDAPAALVDDTLVDDRYRLVARLGGGASAEVWRAVDERLARAVALKLFHPGVTDARRERDGLGSMVRLADPGLVSVYDAGSCAETSRTFLVLEFVAGGTLRDRLAGHWLPAGRATTIAADVARALHYLHSSPSGGTAHGNVTTANILLCADADDVPSAKLADSGVAAMLGAAPAAADDVRALGLVLRELPIGTWAAPLIAAMTDPDPARRPTALDVARRLDDRSTRTSEGRHRVSTHA